MRIFRQGNCSAAESCGLVLFPSRGGIPGIESPLEKRKMLGERAVPGHPGIDVAIIPLIQWYDQGGTKSQPAGQCEEGSHRRCQQDLSAQVRMASETFGQNDRNDGRGNGRLDDDDALDIIVHRKEMIGLGSHFMLCHKSRMEHPNRIRHRGVAQLPIISKVFIRGGWAT